jgi:N-acetylglucosaminyldiphosphoundecaprenol N-acetyl-beta-D-mannosaminyltransferase
MSPRRDFLNIPLDALTMAQSVAVCDALIRSGGQHQHVVLNAAKVVAAHDDTRLMNVIKGCSLINADGQSVVWAARLLGQQVPERVAGIDLMEQLWALAARAGYRVFLLGATAEAVRFAATAARDVGVNVVGYRDGFWAPDEEDTVVAQVAAQRPNVLFLAIPSPDKEFFLAAHRETLGVNLAVGVGGAFDVVAGITHRAPNWMQRSGLEWLYRLIQEPRRMFKRYLVGNSRFTALVLREWVSTRR